MTEVGKSENEESCGEESSEESQEENSDKEEDVSEDLKALFERYRVTEEEHKLFLKLKEAGKDLPLNNEEIITCMVCKKTFKKTFALMESYSFLITEYRFGRYELEKKHIELLQDGYFFSHPEVKGVNGETVVIAKVSNFEYSKLKDDEPSIIAANFLFLHRLCFGNVDTCRKGIICCCDCRGLSLFEIPWDLNRRMAPLFLKVPFRLKYNICIYPPWYFHVVMKLCKVFMSPKIMSRVILTHDLDLVREKVIQLPKQVGGKYDLEMLDALRSVIVKSEKDAKLFDEFMMEKKKEEEEKKRRKEERRKRRKIRKKKKRLRLKKLFRKKKKKVKNEDEEDEESSDEDEESSDDDEEESSSDDDDDESSDDDDEEDSDDDSSDDDSDDDSSEDESDDDDDDE